MAKPAKILIQVNFNAPGIAKMGELLVIDIDPRSELPVNRFWRRRFRDEASEDLRYRKNKKRFRGFTKLTDAEIAFIAALAKGPAPEPSPKPAGAGASGNKES